MSDNKNMFNNLLTLFTIVTLLTIQSGCTSTKALLSSTNYVDEFSSFYLSEDGKKIVVFTDNYHYIIDTPKNLVEVLNSSYAKELTPRFDGFVIDNENNIVGNIQLSLKYDDSRREIMDLAMSHGFIRTDIKWLTFRRQFPGKRYLSNGIKPERAHQELSKSYRVLIQSRNKDKQHKQSITGKIQDTPVSIAKDVVRIGAAAVVMPVFIGCAVKGCN